MSKKHALAMQQFSLYNLSIVLKSTFVEFKQLWLMKDNERYLKTFL